MAEATIFHIIRRADLKIGCTYSKWDDPDQIARLSPQGHRAFLENPYAGKDDEPIQVIATQGNRVVGRIDMLPARVRYGEQSVKIMWGSNLYVPPEARDTLTGVILILKAQGLHHTVGVFGPSQAALPIYQKLKWNDRPITRQILIRHTRSVVEKYAGKGLYSQILVRILDIVVGAFQNLVTRPWTAVHTRGLRTLRSDSMPFALESMLAKPDTGISMERSAAFINWWLTHSFKDDSRNSNDLFLVKDRDGKIVAYFINKVRFHASATHRKFENLLLGSLQDWRIFDSDAINPKGIIMLAFRELTTRNVDVIEFCTDDPNLKTTLKLMGFLTVGAAHLLVKCAPESPLASEGLTDLTKWSVFPGDGDNFFI